METEPTYYIDLITRYFAGEASPEEMDQLYAWIGKDAANRKEFDSYRKTWQALEKQAIRNMDVEDAWNAIRPGHSIADSDSVPLLPLHQQETKKSWFSWPVHVAAAILLVAGISALIYLSLRSVPMQQVVAQNGILEQQLPDGSGVSLKKNASLCWPEHFSEDTREVELKGEAFFNVSHDASKPFIITAGNTRIKVLGTSFYVNTDNKGKVEVVLSSGKVQVYYKNSPENQVVLAPGERAEADPGKMYLTKTLNRDLNYDAWKTGKLVFQDHNLSEIAALLTDVYHEEVTLGNPDIAGCRMTATFDKQSLESVLKVVSATLGVKISRNGNSILISGKGCQ